MEAYPCSTFRFTLEKKTVMGPGRATSRPRYWQLTHKACRHPFFKTVSSCASQMWFYTSTRATLWLKRWHTTETWPYIGTLIGLFALCLVQEALTTFRNAYHARHVKLSNRQLDSPPPVSGGCGCGEKDEFGSSDFGSALSGQPPKCVSLSQALRLSTR